MSLAKAQVSIENLAQPPADYLNGFAGFVIWVLFFSLTVLLVS